ncbi:MAG: hypothetical protein F4206_01275 [Gammaproteobacteria bacterium]|nr:hypothetical protein [Gammaproteobacteria bacterium]MYG65346.1 hypothetical protein [Gammaproteobacteria bacterium]
MAGKRGDRACRPADPELDRLLRTRFRCGRADEQTDLFLDTAPARAVTRLVDPMAEGDAGRAREALANLDRAHPGHRQRDNARKLIEGPCSGFPEAALSTRRTWSE